MKKKLKGVIKIFKTANDKEIEEVFDLLKSYSLIERSKTLIDEYNQYDKEKYSITKTETDNADIRAYQGFLISYIEMKQRQIKKEMEEYETTTIE